jgi:deoxyguanosine kinase
MLENIQYLAIEGVIGAGKTSLAEVLASMYSAAKLLEKYEENPFLMDFYKDRKRFAFQTQIWFLLSRYRQITEQANQPDLFHKMIVSDFIFAKDKIFAYFNLDENEIALYSRISQALEKDIIKPDCVIYLQASTDALMERIARRARPFEKNINRAYIDGLNQAYNHYFFHYDDSPLLIVNTDEVEFIDNMEALDDLVEEITERHRKGGVWNYNPLDKINRRELAKKAGTKSR